MKLRNSLTAATLLLLATPGFAAQDTGETEHPVFQPKPTAPITIGWELPTTPVVGALVEVVLTISADVEITGGRLMMAVDDTLALIDPAAETALGTLRPGEPVTLVVKVLPLVAETQHLRVAVAGDGGGAPQLRTVSVPIRFENARPAKGDSPLLQSPGGEVQSLQAVETVH